jgi:hypothetical protein
MNSMPVNQVVDHLTEAGPLTPERFSQKLGVALASGEVNPYWNFFTFELPAGPFARGELRLNTDGNAALLSLVPRDPPGLTVANVDRAALGPRTGMRPNPSIPPEGIETEYFQRGNVEVATQWWRTSRKLRSLVLKWAPPASAAAPTTGTPSPN